MNERSERTLSTGFGEALGAEPVAGRTRDIPTRSARPTVEVDQ